MLVRLILCVFESLLLRFGDIEHDPHQTLHQLIRYQYNPPVRWDLRAPPQTIKFFDIPRPIIGSDLARYACEPPVPFMRLYHSRLPWYIDVQASTYTGVNLQDLVLAIWTSLRTPITHADYYNDELDDEDRGRINWSFKVRCTNDPAETASGVRRVDFLRRNIFFEGLAKGKQGMWEMKTSKGWTN